jgi:hypothetical protein
MNQFEELDKAYLELIKPCNFINLFDSMTEFERWCEGGTAEELSIMLKEYEKYELYEHCAVIKKVISSLMHFNNYNDKF